ALQRSASPIMIVVGPQNEQPECFTDYVLRTQLVAERTGLEANAPKLATLDFIYEGMSYPEFERTMRAKLSALFPDGRVSAPPLTLIRTPIASSFAANDDRVELLWYWIDFWRAQVQDDPFLLPVLEIVFPKTRGGAETRALAFHGHIASGQSP